MDRRLKSIKSVHDELFRKIIDNEKLIKEITDTLHDMSIRMQKDPTSIIADETIIEKLYKKRNDLINLIQEVSYENIILNDELKAYVIMRSYSPVRKRSKTQKKRHSI